MKKSDTLKLIIDPTNDLLHNLTRPFSRPSLSPSPSNTPLSGIEVAHEANVRPKSNTRGPTMLDIGPGPPYSWTLQKTIALLANPLMQLTKTSVKVVYCKVYNPIPTRCDTCSLSSKQVCLSPFLGSSAEVIY